MRTCNLSSLLKKNWSIKHLDIHNTFLQGSLIEDIYMQQSSHFVHTTYPNYLYKLRKSLYGLKQAPRARYSKLVSSLTHLGFTTSHADQSLFIQHKVSSLIYFLVYVDDIIITWSSLSHSNCIIHSLINFPSKRSWSSSLLPWP